MHCLHMYVIIWSSFMMIYGSREPLNECINLCYIETRTQAVL